MSDEKINNYVVELQSIRGIAALLVVCGHAIGYFNIPDWLITFSIFVFNGHASVVIFFVLSGYVLTKSLANFRPSTNTLILFYTKRMFRIYPALWASSVFALLYVSTLHYNIPVENTSAWFNQRFRSDRYDLLHLVASFAGALAFLLPQLWTIFIEIILSFAMPGIAWLVYKNTRLFWLALGVMLLVSLFIGPFTYYGLGVYAVDFFFGAALCLLPTKFGFFMRLGKFRYWLAVGAALLLISFRSFFDIDYHDPFIQLIETIAATLLIALIIHGNLRWHFLQHPTLVELGEISYSLYLVHFPIMCVLAKLTVLVFPSSFASTNVVSAATILTLSTILVSLPASWLLNRMVERPGVKVGAFVIEQLKRLSVAKKTARTAAERSF